MTAYIQNISRASAFVKILEDNLGYSPLGKRADSWDKMPVLVAHRVIAAERPGFTTPFKDYAETGIEYVIGGDFGEDKFLPATAARRALAAYVYLHSTPSGSTHEPEAIGLFTEKLLHSIGQNNSVGASNDGAYLLFKSAARAELEPHVALTASEHVRRSILLESWPTIIAKITEHDHVSALPHGFYALTQGNCSLKVQERILDVMIRRTHQVADNNRGNCKVLMTTLTKLERVSGVIGDDKQALKLQGAWQGTFDALYDYDPQVGYNWAQNITQSRRPVHPMIRQAAVHVVQTYKVLRHPVSLPAHQGGVTLHYINE